MQKAIIPLHPQTPVNPQEESRKKTAAAAAASCSGGARARTREERSPMERLAGYYCATFGRRNCAPSIARQLREALEAGMEPKAIALCMDAAAEAEYPSWSYAAAVIRNCIAEGALTPEAFRARSAKHRASRRRSDSYQGREYAEGELDYLFDRMNDFDD